MLGLMMDDCHRTEVKTIGQGRRPLLPSEKLLLLLLLLLELCWFTSAKLSSRAYMESGRLFHSSIPCKLKVFHSSDIRVGSSSSILPLVVVVVVVVMAKTIGIQQQKHRKMLGQ